MSERSADPPWLGRRLALLLKGETEGGEKDWAVLAGTVRREAGGLILDRAEGPFEIREEWFHRVRPVPPEVKETLLGAEYMLSLTVGNLVEAGEAAGLERTALRWPGRPGWFPEGARPPDGVQTDRVLLRPLRAVDCERDYEAVTSSRSLLRTWSQSDWPAEDFTLAENLVDLERHEREHLDREAFTFTVLDPGSDRCVGCVYVTPLQPAEGEWSRGARHVARVGFWVRASEVGSDLDRHLLEALLPWFRDAWPFDRVVLSCSPADTRQIELFEAAGMRRRGEITRPDGRRLLGYEDAQSAGERFSP